MAAARIKVTAVTKLTIDYNQDKYSTSTTTANVAFLLRSQFGSQP
jgi:hypothetical protein